MIEFLNKVYDGLSPRNKDSIINAIIAVGSVVSVMMGITILVSAIMIVEYYFR